MWVACNGTNQLLELDTSDGSLVNTVDLGTTTANAPSYLLYDGVNIWVSKFNAGAITRVQARNPTISTTFTVGTNPMGMAFDGQFVWVANNGSNNISKVPANATDSSSVITYNPGCARPINMAYDNTHSAIWVVCNAAPLPGPQVIELNATGGVIHQVSIPNQDSPNCNEIAFDGTNIWVPVSPLNAVIQINTSSLVLTQTSLMGSQVVAVAFDAQHIWAVDVTNNQVFKLLPQPSGPALVTGPFPTGSSPFFIAFDGGNIWVSNAGVTGTGLVVSKM
jgi:hypothetical protein